MLMSLLSYRITTSVLYGFFFFFLPMGRRNSPERICTSTSVSRSKFYFSLAIRVEVESEPPSQQQRYSIECGTVHTSRVGLRIGVQMQKKKGKKKV